MLTKSVPVVLDLRAAGCSVQLLPPESNMLNTWKVFESVQRNLERDHRTCHGFRRHLDE